MPNVANVTIRAGLLLGRFPYAEKGILDRTHLRFYTRKSARRLLEEVRLPRSSHLRHRDAVRARRPGPGPRALSGPVRAFANGTAKLWPTMFGYQFVLEAQR